MNLDILKDMWRNDHNYGRKEQRVFWDNIAATYGEGYDFSFTGDSYLQWMDEEIEFSKDWKVLDIGCGPGCYSLPIAERVKEVVGLDFSENMVLKARENAKRLGIDNVSFIQRDWQNCDMDEFIGQFDLVIAHKTPAICDFNTVERMLKASKRYCFFCFLSGRENNVYDGVDEVLNRPRKRSNIAPLTFLMAWELGHCPVIKYDNDERIHEVDLDRMYKEVMEFKTRDGGFSQEEKNLIYDFVASLSVNGKVREIAKTTVVNMYVDLTQGAFLK